MPNLNPTVIVVEPDLAARASLDALIRRAGWFPRIFGSAAEFLEYRTPIGPSCLVMRIDLPDTDGVDLLRRTVLERKEMPVIVVAEGHDVATSVRAMKAGAGDYLLRPMLDDDLLAAIRNALMQSQSVLQNDSDLLLLRGRYQSLSVREREVMTQVVAGLLNKQVGAVLGISEITVKAHRGRVMRKMGADSLAALVGMSLRLNLPSAPSIARWRLPASRPEQELMLRGA